MVTGSKVRSMCTNVALDLKGTNKVEVIRLIL